MRDGRTGRWLAAGAVALYALVVLLLLPLHAAAEAREAPAEPRPGPVLAAACGDRDCHDPAHGHRGAHAHDPATCVSCVQARVASAPAPAPFVLPVADLPGPGAAPAPRGPAVSLRRSLPVARGPPSLP
jgi:hypothetical protein